MVYSYIPQHPMSLPPRVYPHTSPTSTAHILLATSDIFVAVDPRWVKKFRQEQDRLWKSQQDLEADPRDCSFTTTYMMDVYMYT